MKILELRASGFARLHAVEIRPDGHVVPITGKNRQGKSSVLRAIWTAFVGRSVAPVRAINADADEARLQVDIGNDKVELSIVRTVRKGDHGEVWDLKVQQAGGGRVTRKPQELIDSSLAALAFDPLAFARAAPKDQLARLKGLIRDVDFDEIARRRATLFEERTDANRIAKSEAARASGIALPPGPEPEAVDTADVARQLQEANEANTRRARLMARRDSTVTEINRLKSEAEELRERAAHLEAQAGDMADRIDVVMIDEPVDVAPLTAQLARAEQTARTRALFKARRDHLAAAAVAETQSADLSERIEAIDAAVRSSIEQAKLPAGLSLTEDGVLLNALPFTDASMAEKIMASAEVGMALAGDLRVMLIDEASELDAESMQALAELAERRDYQVWAAKVADDGAAGFVIEDGRVAAHNKEGT